MTKFLYRDPANGKLGGVCAGLAEFLGVDVWLVRAGAVIAFFVGFGFIALIAYIAAVLLLDKKPLQPAGMASDAGAPLRRNIHQTLKSLEQDCTQLEKSVANIEAYVTSREFELHRQFKKL